MEEVYEYLKKTKVNFLATVAEEGVSCQPFGDPVKFDNKIYILTMGYKQVAKQIAKNNAVCIAAYDAEKDDWLRIKARLVDDSNNMAAKQAIIDEFDWAEEAGFRLDNPEFKCYYLSEVKAEKRNSEGEVLAEYSF